MICLGNTPSRTLFELVKIHTFVLLGIVGSTSHRNIWDRYHGKQESCLRIKLRQWYYMVVINYSTRGNVARIMIPQGAGIEAPHNTHIMRWN